MHGAMRLKEAPATILVQCEVCGLRHQWTRRQLLEMGVGKDVAMPDLRNGLARLLQCKRQQSTHAMKSKPCMLSYVDLWGGN